MSTRTATAPHRLQDDRLHGEQHEGEGKGEPQAHGQCPPAWPTVGMAGAVGGGGGGSSTRSTGEVMTNTSSMRRTSTAGRMLACWKPWSVRERSSTRPTTRPAGKTPSAPDVTR